MLATITEQRSETFELAGLPGGWMRLVAFLALVALCASVLWLYRREERSGTSAVLRRWLAAIRCVVILLLAGVWLEPVVATYTKRIIAARVVAIVDRSGSMSVADAADSDVELTRMERVAKLLSADDADFARRSAALPDAAVRPWLSAPDHAWLKRLAARNDLSLYAFGERVASITPPWLAPAASAPASATGAPGASQPATLGQALAATEGYTDLGSALARVSEDLGESPIAAIVVITDGAVNQGMNADDIAAYAKRFRAPIYTVGVGRDAEPPNLRIANLAAPATVAKGDPMELRVELSATGIEAVRTTLELVARAVNTTGGSATLGSERVVATRDVTIGGDTPTVEVKFPIQADDAGEFVYSARVATLPEEPVKQDNSRSASVRVLDERLRVLLVAGRPSFEFQRVSTLLIRDRSIDVSCWLQSADVAAIRDGDVPITELPQKLEDLLSYDAILLMDPDPREFDTAWAVAARKLVDELGGGLLIQAGQQYTTRFLKDQRLSDLVAMLPITPDPEAEMRLSSQGAFQTRAVPLRVPDSGRGHPLLALHSDAVTNAAVLDSLPGAWWWLPVLREKSLATVLMRAVGSASDRSDGAVLLAAQPFGAGRVVFMGFDSTWRWRATAEPYFNRFWIQTVRYLSQARRQGGSRRGSIVLDRDTLSVGDYAKIEARVLDAGFQPWTETEIEATVELGDGTTSTVRLSAIPGREGWYAGRAAFEQDGPAVIRLRVPASGAAPAETVAKYVQIQPPDVELRNLRMQADQLKRIAESTGGKFVPIAAAATLPDEIQNASQIRTIPGPRRALWDRGWVMLLIAGLLAVEWSLRRRNHLL
ncbi:MAG: hypothetical protein ACKVS9_01660 [Phycisphaerae bacterium]